MRPIDADALKKDLQESYERLREIYNGLKYDDERQICAGQLTTFTECILRIEEAPTIEAEPVKHGRWIFKNNPITDPKGYFIRIVCSECNLHTGQKSNYCPKCGAKMDLEGNT